VLAVAKMFSSYIFIILFNIFASALLPEVSIDSLLKLAVNNVWSTHSHSHCVKFLSYGCYTWIVLELLSWWWL